MSFVSHVLEFLAILVVVLLLGAGVTYLAARRFVRRRWHRMRTHVATRGVLAAGTFLVAGRDRFGARATPEELSQGTAARVRRRMWVAVEDAEEAVRHAATHDAPVAELPAVCRSLRTVAGEMDRLLRLERRLPRGVDRPDTVRVQVAELIRAARDVQVAALRASSDATEPQVRSLVRQAGDEVEIVAAALASMRRAAPHPR
jgi:hypothetical protein